MSVLSFRDGQIMHASGQVRIDKVDHFGIYNLTKNKYTHKLRVVKRILPEIVQSKKVEKPEEVIENQIELF